MTMTYLIICLINCYIGIFSFINFNKGQKFYLTNIIRTISFLLIFSCFLHLIYFFNSNHCNNIRVSPQFLSYHFVSNKRKKLIEHPNINQCHYKSKKKKRKTKKHSYTYFFNDYFYLFRLIF